MSIYTDEVNPVPLDLHVIWIIYIENRFFVCSIKLNSFDGSTIYVIQPVPNNVQVPVIKIGTYFCQVFLVLEVFICSNDLIVIFYVKDVGFTLYADARIFDILYQITLCTFIDTFDWFVSRCEDIVIKDLAFPEDA